MLRYLWISLVVIIADQATKLIADSQLVFHQPVNVLPYFDWYLSYNTGAAFSFLADAGGWQRWFLTTLALALILGGALGNAIDRMLYGHVIDFIQVWLGSYPWPAFNVADSAIFVGAAILIVSGLIMPYRDASAENKG